MKHLRSAIASAAILLLLLVMVVPCPPPSRAAQSSELGTLKVTKTVPSVTFSNKVTIVLTILNNGSLPVANIEIYEYFNPSFTLQGGATLQQRNGTALLPLTQSTTVTQVQAIIDPPPPDSLEPGESMTLTYTELAAGSGDFQVPPSLVWFTYMIGSAEVKASYYSNGVVIHIPSATEKIAIQFYPYVLAAATFTITMIILVWARRQLSLVDRKRFSRN